MRSTSTTTVSICCVSSLMPTCSSWWKGPQMMTDLLHLAYAERREVSNSWGVELLTTWFRSGTAAYLVSEMVATDWVPWFSGRRHFNWMRAMHTHARLLRRFGATFKIQLNFLSGESGVVDCMGDISCWSTNEGGSSTWGAGKIVGEKTVQRVCNCVITRDVSSQVSRKRYHSWCINACLKQRMEKKLKRKRESSKLAK